MEKQHKDKLKTIMQQIRESKTDEDGECLIFNYITAHRDYTNYLMEKERQEYFDRLSLNNR
jgi:5-hydroxyisourate hydrolase-like protein (transthyretin family)